MDKSIVKVTVIRPLVNNLKFKKKQCSKNIKN